jgi:FdhD protein
MSALSLDRDDNRAGVVDVAQTDGLAVQQECPLRLDLAAGDLTRTAREIAVEVPVSITYNGLAHAVMMASPRDLEDFALGFTLTQKIVDTIADIRGLERIDLENGTVLKLEIDIERFQALAKRRRNVVGQTGCGMCGIIELENALLPLIPLSTGPKANFASVAAALKALGKQQPLHRLTGAMHAAGFFTAAGEAVIVREDVGRHNALDKLLGAMARARHDPATGFAVITSRCSYELVEKAVIGRLPMLVTISAPTSLAISRAREANLTLLSLARVDSALVFNDPFYVFSPPDAK